MAVKRETEFDPKAFLAKIGDGRSIGTYHENQVVFSQGERADAVFYIQEGKVKITVVSEQGKEAVVAILGEGEFFGVECLARQTLRMSTSTAMAVSSLTVCGKTSER
ncbi:MAG TPA: cyclic nucleotide-binding domain-containing protein [Candidatus Limnocylindria bacterium]|nr:cyclic nucleotide-binding domain-containing protein [Candidatus Limnocylindria bacterium]